jgi:hypothetical protein
MRRVLCRELRLWGVLLWRFKFAVGLVECRWRKEDNAQRPPHSHFMATEYGFSMTVVEMHFIQLPGKRSH